MFFKLQLLFLIISFASIARATEVARIESVDLAGPWLGVTILSNSFVDKLGDESSIELPTGILQIGWHFENRFFSMRNGTTMVSEFIALAGGFEQGLFLPSFSWLLGMRSKNGIEFGLGPNISLAGSAIVLAAGINFQSDEVNFPVNLAVTTSDDGPRFSILVGFNLRNEK
jgi:hypothetical protein